MLTRIGANYLYIDVLSLSLPGYLLPFTPGQLDGIAGVRHHAPPQAQIIRSDSVREAIALALYFDCAQISERLLDSIDSQINGVDSLCDYLRKRSFAAPGKAGEDIEDGLLGFCISHA
jgi:hypothetical protein